MPDITEKFNILECQGILNSEQLETVLKKFPVDFYLVDEYVDPGISFQECKKEPVDVYHSTGVISIYPPKGKRLSNAILTKWNFPINPDNIMDDQLGLRCCYHPRLSAFGVELVEHGDEIEIDIHKFSKENNYKWKICFS